MQTVQLANLAAAIVTWIRTIDCLVVIAFLAIVSMIALLLVVIILFIFRRLWNGRMICKSPPVLSAKAIPGSATSYYPSAIEAAVQLDSNKKYLLEPPTHCVISLDDDRKNAEEAEAERTGFLSLGHSFMRERSFIATPPPPPPNLPSTPQFNQQPPPVGYYSMPYVYFCPPRAPQPYGAQFYPQYHFGQNLSISPAPPPPSGPVVPKLQNAFLSSTLRAQSHSMSYFPFLNSACLPSSTYQRPTPSLPITVGPPCLQPVSRDYSNVIVELKNRFIKTET